PHLRRAVEMAHRLYHEPNSMTALVLHHHAEALWALELYDAALPPAREAAAMYREHADWSVREEAHTLAILVKVLAAPGGYAALVGPARRLLEFQRKLLGPDDKELGNTLATLGLGLERLGTLDAAQEAAPLLRECLEIRARTAPDDWRLSNTRSLLGGI